ncbi:tigger transposable element-derived protein 6-like [Branchiostoma floridae]|uniref:Tigger transposable element-derived protein 6-like n=1 Tax=Branchiostoma floridae TaxID=7739 RepID=A0A9J7LH35_BRAFL|nr:tigger transposable element-derived protein 6-like [Branchiostoma floridae]
MASGAKRKRQQYHQADMEAALEAANNGASVYSLAKKFGIPRTTLIGRIKGHHGEVQGRPSVLTPEDEEALVGYAKYMSDRGFPLTVRVTKALAQQIEIKRAKGRGESPRFKEAGPGKKWWRGFKRRHPDISLRSPDQLDKERALMATPGVIFEYFLMLEDKLTEANAKNKNPHVIYNADETGVDLSAKISKVIVTRGEKKSPSRRVGSRDHVSALVCVSAAGQTVPPMIVFSKGFPGGAYTEGGPANAIYGFSDSGFIDEFLFERWFTKVFLSHCHKERPIVLIVDQHYSHFTLKVLEAAVANNVVILGLPPHCTHFLQPLDVGIFAPLKSKWALTLEVMQAANPHFQVTKRNFAKIFNTVYDHTVTPSLIKSSFQKSGIFPLNEDAIDDRWVKMSAIPGEKFSSATPPPHPSTSASATPPSQPSTSASATPPPQPSTSTSVTPPPQPSTSASATPPPHPSTSASATPPPQPSTSTSVTPPPHPSTSASVTPPPQPSTSTSGSDS